MRNLNWSVRVYGLESRTGGTLKKSVEDLAEEVGAYQDDFGKWIFRDTDDLYRLYDLIIDSPEIKSLKSMVEMLKTDLAAAELEIKNMRRKDV